MLWFGRKTQPSRPVTTNGAAATGNGGSASTVPSVAPAVLTSPATESAPLPHRTTITTTMMDFPLTLVHAFDRAQRYFANREIVTVTADGYDRSTYGEVCRRVLKMAGAMERLGVHRGDRIATMAWNTTRHYELYLAIPCMGSVLHTLNLRLPIDQLGFIINDAADKILFVDADLFPIIEKLAGQIPTVEHIVVMNGKVAPTATNLPHVMDYEDLMATGPDNYQWPALDERDACAMCYTSGTTGNPKGVVYSHRSSLLHAITVTQADTIALSERDIAFPLVPMFHVNAWALPHAAALVGARLVFPGRFMTPDICARVIAEEKVTLSAGVPTIWIGMLQVLAKQPDLDFSHLNRVVIGGSAAPAALIQALHDRGIPVLHAWGMTEMSPIGTVSRLLSTLEDKPFAEQLPYMAKQGRVVPGVEMRIVDLETGQEVPSDGVAFGEIQVRGPWITRDYYHGDNLEQGQEKFTDGWFRTGDVATMDPYGYIQIVDRTKDVVKSGGEWISSVILESEIMAHPKVLEAAVIGLPHPKWQERPVAVVVPKPEFVDILREEDILMFLEPRVAKWWLPDRVIFAPAIPKTSVGKFDKKVMRAEYTQSVHLGDS